MKYEKVNQYVDKIIKKIDLKNNPIIQEHKYGITVEITSSDYYHKIFNVSFKKGDINLGLYSIGGSVYRMKNLQNIFDKVMRLISYENIDIMIDNDYSDEKQVNQKIETINTNKKINKISNDYVSINQDYYNTSSYIDINLKEEALSNFLINNTEFLSSIKKISKLVKAFKSVEVL